MCLHSVQLTTRVRIATPTGNMPEASEGRGHLFTQDTLDGTNGVRIIEVPMYCQHFHKQNLISTVILSSMRSGNGTSEG